MVRLPNGFTLALSSLWRVHFWPSAAANHDPATGRAGPVCKAFLDTVYQHTFPVPAGAWRMGRQTNSRCRRAAVSKNIANSHYSLLRRRWSMTCWQGLVVLDVRCSIGDGAQSNPLAACGAALVTQSLQSFIDKT
ncbi:MAG: hypothetical protein H6669_17645 [Ardenticatenaceae bacterium]|nr:hypothetical protein [Ardenticatenaceae bacterium]